MAVCSCPPPNGIEISDLLLRLIDESQPTPIVGKVVWLIPVDAEGNRVISGGIQFSSQDQGAARRKIEGYLADMPASDRPTHTL